jgi:hypothetical protein
MSAVLNHRRLKVSRDANFNFIDQQKLVLNTSERWSISVFKSFFKPFSTAETPRQALLSLAGVVEAIF